MSSTTQNDVESNTRRTGAWWNGWAMGMVCAVLVVGAMGAGVRQTLRLEQDWTHLYQRFMAECETQQGLQQYRATWSARNLVLRNNIRQLAAIQHPYPDPIRPTSTYSCRSATFDQNNSLSPHLPNIESWLKSR